MADNPGAQSTDLISALPQQCQNYQFWQLMRLLTNALPTEALQHDYLHRWLRLLPAADLRFPAADVQNCQWTAGNKIELQLNFMGLYGVDSPLPHYFLMAALQEDETGARWRSFLNIFSQRIYTLLYLAWIKYHPIAQEQAANKYRQYLMHISGRTLTQDDPEALAFCGLYGAKVHSASSLTWLLEQYLPSGTNVNLLQFQPRWVEMLGENRLGVGNSLGDNILLGEMMLDCSSKITIELSGMTLSTLFQWLPGAKQGRQLGQLINRYLNPLLEFDIIFKLKPSQTVMTILGQDAILLGWSCWLGQPNQTDYELIVNGRSLCESKLSS